MLHRIASVGFVQSGHIMAKTLFDKVWENHLVTDLPGGGALLYIDRHLVHEVTSPQAFDGLREKGRAVRRPDLTFATVDHNVPTDGRPIDESTISGQQLAALERNCSEFGIPLFGYDDPNQGIVHIIGPQLGLTLPGLTIVCGDSHTSTHGAFGALAFGIGTTEVEHVLATQTLRTAKKPASLGIDCRGGLPAGVTAKDIILAIIRMLGAAGATGTVVEYRGEAIRRLPMSGRMTICNMSIEMGARAGMIAPDEVTLEYITSENRPYAPRGEALNELVDSSRRLPTEPGALFDRTEHLNVSRLQPQVSWGTNPAMTVDIDQLVPEPRDGSEERAQKYMGLKPGTPVADLDINTVFIGSCTNARLEDLREAASIVKGRKVASGVRAMVVPGSAAVRAQAEHEGLDAVFKNAGFEWHRAGCSMCLGMNGDILRPGQRSASTSNRPYEGRQGPGSRTHLVSPLTAAATALAGRLADPRPLM
jgi:3-isopropylmalate/(R)-2-methylmalate dehydratase large subunit